jgi:hypothetical protein
MREICSSEQTWLHYTNYTRMEWKRIHSRSFSFYLFCSTSSTFNPIQGIQVQVQLNSIRKVGRPSWFPLCTHPAHRKCTSSCIESIPLSYPQGVPTLEAGRCSFSGLNSTITSHFPHNPRAPAISGSSSKSIAPITSSSSAGP